MKAISWLFAGMIGGLIGAAIWSATVYFSGWELGVLACVIGVFAGVGVRSAAGKVTGAGPALIATLCALVCVVAGKFGSVALMLYADQPTQEDAIVMLSDVVVREWEREGRQIKWPFGTGVEDAYSEKDYPADIWAQAEARWYEIPQADRERYLTSYMHLALLDTEYVVSYIADEIVEDRLMSGTVGGLSSGGYVMEDYDPFVWTEAVHRWNMMSPEERRAFETGILRADGVSAEGGADPMVAVMITLFSLGLWDLLWVGLAAASAWKLGYGSDNAALQGHHMQQIASADRGPASSAAMPFGRPMGGVEGPGAGAPPMLGRRGDSGSGEEPIVNPNVRPGMAEEADDEVLGDPGGALFDDDGDGPRFMREGPAPAPKPMIRPSDGEDADDGGSAFFKARRAG